MLISKKLILDRSIKYHGIVYSKFLPLTAAISNKTVAGIVILTGRRSRGLRMSHYVNDIGGNEKIYQE
jgi:hypothetical protein